MGGYYSVSVSVALLLARFGSGTPLGAVTLAVSESVPVAEGLMSLIGDMGGGGQRHYIMMSPVPVAVNLGSYTALRRARGHARNSIRKSSVTAAPVTSSGPGSVLRTVTSTV